MEDRYPDDYIQPASQAEVARAVFPGGLPKLNNSPFNAAYLWWGAVINGDRELAEAVSYNAEDWTFPAIAADLRRHVLCQHVVPSAEADDIAYAKMLPDPGYEGFAKRAFILNRGRWLTLVRVGERWYVWGLSEVPYRPDAQRVKIG